MQYQIYYHTDGHLFFTMNHIEGIASIGCKLYKFIRLKNNLHDKNYVDQKSNDVLRYTNGMLLFDFITDKGSSIFYVDDKDVIKQISESIISEAIKMNIISP